MFTFEQLLEATTKMNTEMRRMAFDMNPSSLQRVVARKCKCKITIEQAELLCKTAEETVNKYNATVA